MRRWLPLSFVVFGALFLAACRSDKNQADPESTDATKQEQQEDILGVNAGCYVCHMTFVSEELASVHLEAKISCTDCHGLSQGHANDEHIGATPPDKIIERDQINDSCRTCHEAHDVAPEKVVALWLKRSQEKTTTQPAQQAVVCTDCHGNHKISGN